MSLDIDLRLPGKNPDNNGSGIFIRDDGSVKEISRHEWDIKFPGREPIIIDTPGGGEYVYSANITHNLIPMTTEAGVYKCIWRPDEINITHAVNFA